MGTSGKILLGLLGLVVVLGLVGSMGGQQSSAPSQDTSSEQATLQGGISQDSRKFGTQVKAYEDINFGESKATTKYKVKQSQDIELSVVSDWGNTLSTETVIVVQSQKVTFDIYFHFYENQLYRVEIESPDRTADYFDSSVKAFRNKLVDIIERQYGGASRTYDVDFLDVESGMIIWSHIWGSKDVGENKEIKIGFSTYEAEYESVMHINYLPLLRSKEQAEKKEEEESTQDTSENF